MPYTALQAKEDAELFGLEAKRKPLDQKATAQLIGTGALEPDLKAQRQAVIDRIDELANAKTARAKLVLKEELRKIGFDGEVAQSLRRANQVVAAAAKKKLDDLLLEVRAAEDEWAKVKNLSDGVFNVQMRLAKFKVAHPDIIIDTEEV